MKSPRFPWSLALIVLLSSPLAAQTSVRQDTTVRDAVALFKASNSAAALTLIQGRVRTGTNAAHPDLQIARHLAGVTAALRSGGDTARAQEAKSLFLARLAQPEGRMTAKDAATAWALSGGIHEMDGDLAVAKFAYERAVALDANQQQAAARLALIIAREQRAAAKPATNALLQQRAGSAPTR